MTNAHAIPRSAFGPDSMPLDSARTAWEWLVTGPHPVTLNGAVFPGLPDRRVALDELRALLLRRGCPQITRDAVWRHLVLRSRTEGATWTVACVGMALPGLTKVAATQSARFADDPADIHSAVLTGFIGELATIDLRKPRVMLRLRWAAYRAGRTAVRDALDAPLPSGQGFRSAEPVRPWSHPDFVLARAVAAGAINRGEAELISSTRLGDVPVAEIAEQRGVGYTAVQMARSRAEHRLVDYLGEQKGEQTVDTGARPGHAVEDHALDTVTLTPVTLTAPTRPSTRSSRRTGARRGTRPPTRRSRSVTAAAGTSARKSGRRVWKKAPKTGVKGCGNSPAPATPPATGRAAKAATSEVPPCD